MPLTGISVDPIGIEEPFIGKYVVLSEESFYSNMIDEKISRRIMLFEEGTGERCLS